MVILFSYENTIMAAFKFFLVPSFTKDDHKKSIRCIVKLVYGQPILVKKMVNIARE